MTSLLLLCLLGVSLASAFLGLRLAAWSALLVVTYLLFAAAGEVPLLGLLATGLLLVVVLVPLNMRPLRQQFLS
ncbi:MAG TPA: hypothetical protein VK830_06215, partial [Xanthomonadales bacterium]|nr:hypothetical protein [Xanthomonadales bacterium]